MKCPVWTMQSVILNLTEHPYAATYSSSQAKKKTLTGRKRDVSPEAVRIILGAAQMTAAGPGCVKTGYEPRMWRIVFSTAFLSMAVVSPFDFQIDEIEKDFPSSN